MTISLPVPPWDWQLFALFIRLSPIYLTIPWLFVCPLQDQGVVIQSAYGSSKDITVYSGLGLSPEQIHVVGKANKKQHTQAQVWRGCLLLVPSVLLNFSK